MAAWKYFDSNSWFQLDDSVQIVAKVLCPEHAEEKRIKGKLPQRQHTHDEYERNLGLNDNEDEKKSFYTEPALGDEFFGLCLILSLIAARAYAIFHEKRSHTHAKHHFHVDWEDIKGVNYKGKSLQYRRDSARRKLMTNLRQIQKKCSELKGTALETVIPAFCELFQDVEVFVICPEYSFRKFKYQYPEEGASLGPTYKIFLLQERVGKDTFHIKFIHSIKEYAKHYGGLECIFGCGFVGWKFQTAHKDCREGLETCQGCKYIIERNGFFKAGSHMLKKFHCDGTKEEEPTKCEKCLNMLRSKHCYERHKVTGCFKNCGDCGGRYYQDHKCGEDKCLKCDAVLNKELPKTIKDLDSYEAIHQCPYTPAKLPASLPNLGFFTLAIDEQTSCITCVNQRLKKKKKCKLHEQQNTNNGIHEIQTYGVALCSEFGKHGNFRIKKWIKNVEGLNEEELETMPYLTNSVKERNNLVSILPGKSEKKKEPKKKKKEPRKRKKKQEEEEEEEEEKSSPTNNRIKGTINCFKDSDSPLWQFLDYILQKKFNNYVFMCDSVMELQALLR